MSMNRFFSAKLALSAACLLFASQAALACTTDNWTGGTSGGVLASGPAGPDGNPQIARYSGVCAMQTAEDTAGWVQDNSPGGIDRIVARFYVLNNLTGSSAQIYRGFSTESGSGSLFTVRLAADGGVRLIDNTTQQEVSQSGSTKWLSVEIDWSRGPNGSISLSVNGQDPEELINIGNSAAAPLQAVRLGNLNGAAGILNFDAYESRRSTAVGRLLACDAQGDGAINVLDALAVINEINDAGFGTGQPDCDDNGSVNVLDALEIITIINS